MSSPERETEIKLRFPSSQTAVERLVSLGARLVQAREREDNVLYDRATEPLRRAGRALRLRRTGSRTFLTLKSPVPGPHVHKVRIEQETSIGEPDALARILEGLGYVPSYRYQKYRSVYSLDDVTVCVDETPLGSFVELEGEPDAIDSLARRLGFRRDQYICASYRELHEEAIASGFGTTGDLLLQDEEAGHHS